MFTTVGMQRKKLENREDLNHRSEEGEEQEHDQHHSPFPSEQTLRTHIQKSLLAYRMLLFKHKRISPLFQQYISTELKHS